MKAVPFRESNQVLMPPKGQEKTVFPLHVINNGVSCISCWEVSDEELEELKKTKKIWLSVMGNTHPPLLPMIESPLRDDIGDYTQVRVRLARPEYEKFVNAKHERVVCTLVDGVRVWEQEIPQLLQPNSEQHRKIMAEHLLWILADKNEGVSKLHALTFYDVVLADDKIVPDMAHLTLYIKKDDFIRDLRNGLVTNNVDQYMFIDL